MNLESAVERVESAIEPVGIPLAKGLGLLAVAGLLVSTVFAEGSAYQIWSARLGFGAAIAAFTLWLHAVKGHCRRCGRSMRSHVRYCPDCGQRGPLDVEKLDVESEGVEKVAGTPFDGDES